MGRDRTRRAVLVSAAGLALGLALAGCWTRLGTNIPTDTFVPPGAVVEPLGPVSATKSVGHWLWAVEADKAFYDEVRRMALKQRGGDILINLKVKTTLGSYLDLYYTTEITIEGIAARVVMPAAAPPGS
jgi:hypothetical protein